MARANSRHHEWHKNSLCNAADSPAGLRGVPFSLSLRSWGLRCCYSIAIDSRNCRFSIIIILIPMTRSLTKPAPSIGEGIRHLRLCAASSLIDVGSGILPVRFFISYQRFSRREGGAFPLRSWCLHCRCSITVYNNNQPKGPYRLSPT